MMSPTTSPRPTSARRFWANVLATSSHGLPLVATSPPSGSGPMSMSVSVPAGPAPAPSPVDGSAPTGGRSVPDPRIENRIADVGDQIAHDGDYATRTVIPSITS